MRIALTVFNVSNQPPLTVSPCPSPRPFFRLFRIVTTRALDALSSGATETEVDRRSEQIAVRPGAVKVQNIHGIPINQKPVPSDVTVVIRQKVTTQRMILVLRRQRLGDPQDLDYILEQIHFITPLFARLQIPLELCRVLYIKHRPHRHRHRRESRQRDRPCSRRSVFRRRCPVP